MTYEQFYYWLTGFLNGIEHDEYDIENNELFKSLDRKIKTINVPKEYTYKGCL